MCDNFFCYFLIINNCSLSLDRRSGSVNIDLVISVIFDYTGASFGFTLYAVLYKRGHEPVIEDPEMIRNLKPSSEEQIDQPKRQMLRAGIAASQSQYQLYT